jgi:hypothetical protein
MSFGGDPDYKINDCRHREYNQDGICLHCGVKAAIMIPLEKREPVSDKGMTGEITYAVETFEEACDQAIKMLGWSNANTILSQRRERDRIINDREMLEKYPGEKMVMSQKAATRIVSDEEFQAKLKAVSEQERQQAATHRTPGN